MKKTLLALAVGVAFSAANAAVVFDDKGTQVEVKGDVKAALTTVFNETQEKTYGTEVKEENIPFYANSVLAADAKLAFKVKHELQSGFASAAVAEARVKGGTGTANSAEFDRFYAGLVFDDVGTLTFGKQANAVDDVVFTHDNIFGVNPFDGIDKADTLIKFKSADFEGLSFAASYTLNSTTNPDDAKIGINKAGDKKHGGNIDLGDIALGAFYKIGDEITLTAGYKGTFSKYKGNEELTVPDPSAPPLENPRDYERGIHEYVFGVKYALPEVEVTANIGAETIGKPADKDPEKNNKHNTIFKAIAGVKAPVADDISLYGDLGFTYDDELQRYDGDKKHHNKTISPLVGVEYTLLAENVTTFAEIQADFNHVVDVAGDKTKFKSGDVKAGLGLKVVW